MKRHLCYYIYPVAAGRPIWKHNIDEIKRRYSLFTGTKIVSIAVNSTRDRLDPPEMVEEYFGKDLADIRRVDHGPNLNGSTSHAQRGKLGEVVAFVPMLQAIKEVVGPGDHLFYAHSKGVTHKHNRDEIGVHDWTDMMYASLLDKYFPTVYSLLKIYPIAGSFKKESSEQLDKVSWHYSGTFFWLRCDDLYKRNWKNIPQYFGGTEAWPGMHYSTEEAASVFFGGAEKISLYKTNWVPMGWTCYKHWPWQDRFKSRDEKMVREMRQYMEELEWAGQL